ncbi:MAG: class I SAM-dependent methyltransferase, partial [Chitinophagaceae bacterium]
MGVKLARKKPRILWASLFYRVHKLLPLSSKAKFKLYLNMAWWFERLSHEMSFRYYNAQNHPLRIHPRKFLQRHLNKDFTVLDLGCHSGDITVMAAEVSKKVVGIDYNAGAIEQAKATYKRDNLTFIAGEAFEFLSKNEEKFDVLILSHILEHLDNPQSFLDTFKGFFRYIYIELPDFDKSYHNHYRKDLNLQLVYTDDDHVSEFDRDELAAI